MQLAACWLAIYADDERRTEVFHCIYIYTPTSKKESINEPPLAQMGTVYPI